MDICTEILTRQNKAEQSLLVLTKRIENMERNLFQIRIPQFDLTQPAQKFDYILQQTRQSNNSNNNQTPPPPPPPPPSITTNPQQQLQDLNSLSIDSSRSFQQINLSSSNNANNNINGDMEGIKRSISNQMFIPRLMSYGYGGIDMSSTFLPEIPDNPNKLRRLSSDIEFTLDCKTNRNGENKKGDKNKKS